MRIIQTLCAVSYRELYSKCDSFLFIQFVRIYSIEILTKTSSLYIFMLIYSLIASLNVHRISVTLTYSELVIIISI